MRRLFLASFVTLVFAQSSFGTIHPAADGAQATILALHNSVDVIDGDTISIPAGTNVWTGSLIITKAITIAGSGIDQTFIEDGVVSRFGALAFQGTTYHKTYRLTGITFRNHTGVDDLGTFGVIQVNGQGHICIDGCMFDKLRGRNIVVTEGATGVVHGGSCAQWDTSQLLEIYHNIWRGVGAYGDKSWSLPIEYGSTNVFVVEGMGIWHAGGTPNTSIIDCQSGSRVVFRNNNCTNVTVHTHGWETNGRYRSNFWLDEYDNTFVSTTNFMSLNNQVNFIRGGTGLFHGNTFSGYGVLVGAVNYMSRNVFGPWDGTNGSGANGLNNFHSNYTSGPFFSGTAAASDAPGPVFTTGIQVSGSPGWTPNQWRGYSLVNMSISGHNGAELGSHPFGEIITNSTDTLYYLCDIRPGSTNMTFTAGQTIHLYHVNACLDQPGSTYGSYLSGDSNPGFLPFDQRVEPIRIWNNTRNGVLNGGPVIDTYDYSVIVSGRNYLLTGPPIGYSQLVYPHPLFTAMSGGSNTPSVYPPISFGIRTIIKGAATIRTQ